MHELGLLQAHEGEEQTFVQIYFHDPNDQVTGRQEIFPIFRLTSDPKIRVTSSRSAMRIRISESVKQSMGLSRKIRLGCQGCYRRPMDADSQYDLPSVNEVAVPIPGDGRVTEPRVIIIQGRDGQLKSISETHPVNV